MEAYVMRVPAVSYRKTVNDFYDDGFYKLPNRLSHQCFDFEELRTTLARILGGDLGAAEGDGRKALIDHYLAGREGPLACEQMVAVLVAIADDLFQTPEPALRRRMIGWFKATHRRMHKV